MIEPRDVKRYERELAAMLIRAGDEDPEGFATIAELISSAYHGLFLAAQLCRAQHGYSWRQLAHAMNVPASTAHARFANESTVDLDADVLKLLIRQHVVSWEATEPKEIQP